MSKNSYQVQSNTAITNKGETALLTEALIDLYLSVKIRSNDEVRFQKNFKLINNVPVL